MLRRNELVSEVNKILLETLVPLHRGLYATELSKKIVARILELQLTERMRD